MSASRKGAGAPATSQKRFWFGLFFMSALVACSGGYCSFGSVSCGSRPPVPGRAAGTAGGACRDSGIRCNSGLTCSGGVCRSTAGTESGECRRGENACDADLVCHVGICSRCGSDGNVCCPSDGRARGSTVNGRCDSGLTCAAGSCRRCGDPGQECCPPESGIENVCHAGATCNISNGMCEGTSGGGACSGSTVFSVPCQFATGCGEMVAAAGNTYDDAVECARSRGCVAFPDEPHDTFAFCMIERAPVDTQVPAFSSEAALACARYLSPAGRLVPAESLSVCNALRDEAGL